MDEFTITRDPGDPYVQVLSLHLCLSLCPRCCSWRRTGSLTGSAISAPKTSGWTLVQCGLLPEFEAVAL